MQTIKKQKQIATKMDVSTKTSPLSSKFLLFFFLLCFSSTAIASAIAPTNSVSARAHRSTRQLAHAALAASAVRARDASAFFSHPSTSERTGGSGETMLFGDCTLVMADSASRLEKAVGEWSRLGPAGSRGFGLCIDNIKTWVSAALTDQETCLASLDGSGAGVEVRRKVAVVKKATSRALSLVNRIG